MKSIENPLSYLIRHLLYHIYFFVDDVLLLAKVSNSHAGIVFDILNRFAMFAGLKVNFAKSKVFFSATTKRSTMDLTVPNTCIKQILTLENYLGFPMLHDLLQRKDFEFLDDKISNILASW